MWHHAYYHAALPEGPLQGATHGLAHTIISALIHGLIYGAIFRLMRGMSTGEVLLAAVMGIAFIGGVWWLWNRRGRRA